MAGHRQDISRISKGSQNILIYNLFITTFDFQGVVISGRAFALLPPGVVPPLIISTALLFVLIDAILFNSPGRDYNYKSKYLVTLQL